MLDDIFTYKGYWKNELNYQKNNNKKIYLLPENLKNHKT